MKTQWVDAQLSPGIARWIREALGIDAIAVRDLGLRDAEDADIFTAARAAGAVVLTKDSDFVDCGAERLPATDNLADLWKHVEWAFANHTT